MWRYSCSDSHLRFKWIMLVLVITALMPMAVSFSYSFPASSSMGWSKLSALAINNGRRQASDRSDALKMILSTSTPRPTKIDSSSFDSSKVKITSQEHPRSTRPIDTQTSINQQPRHHGQEQYSYNSYKAALVKLAISSPRNRSRPTHTPVGIDNTSTACTTRINTTNNDNDRSHPSAGRKAERMLREMQQNYERSNQKTERPPDSYCMTLVITAYANSGHFRAAEDCLRLLDEMDRTCDAPAPNNGNEDKNYLRLEADVVTYTAVLKAIARSESRSAGPSAEAAFRRMIKHGVQPNTYSYGAVIGAWTRSHSVVAADRAETWLKRMEEMYLASYMYKPQQHQPKQLSSDSKSEYNATTATTVAAAANGSTRQRQRHRHRHRQQPRQHGGLSTIPYNNVLHAFRIQSAFRGGFGNSTMIRAEALLKRMEESEHVQPDIISYTNVIQAWAKSSSVSKSVAAERSQIILNNMEDMYDETRNERIRPDAVCYASVINAWGKSGVPGAAQHAQDLLDHMEERLARTPHHDKIMSNANKSWDDCVLYTSVMDAWAREGNPEKAVALLERIEDHFDAGTSSARPNSRSYTAVLLAYANSNRPDRAKQAHDLLRTMVRLYTEEGNTHVRPSVFTYTAVFQACFCGTRQARTRTIAVRSGGGVNFPDGREREHGNEHQDQDQDQEQQDAKVALEIAIGTLAELRTSSSVVPEGPNYVAYLTFIKAVASCQNAEPIVLVGNNATALLSKSDGEQPHIVEHIIRDAFEHCCQDGMVHYNVVRQLQRSIPADSFQELVMSHMRVDGSATAASANSPTRTTSSRIFSEKGQPSVAAFRSLGSVSIRSLRIDMKQLPSEWCRSVKIKNKRRER